MSSPTLAGDVPGLPPYPETVTPVGISELLATVILLVTLVAAVALVIYLLRASQRRNNTDARAARTQTIVAAAVTVGAVMAINAFIVGTVNGVATSQARETNFQNILAYNRQYAAAIEEVYGIDITSDDANALLSGVEVDVTLPNGDPASIMIIDEFEPQLGIMDVGTEEPIATLDG